MTEEIPKPWRETVARILRRGSSGREILICRSALSDWRRLTLGAYDFTLLDALADALAQDRLVGRKHTMHQAGETYAFIFPHYVGTTQIPVYTKINLMPDQHVMIYSAHLPEKQDDLTL